LNPTQIKFTPVIKDRLFYDQYEYCFGFKLTAAHTMRRLSHKSINHALDQRISWQEMAHKRWPSTLHDAGWNIITDQNREDLHTVCDIILDSGFKFKLAVSTNSGWLYTNDVELIDRLIPLRCLTSMKYTRAVINRPKNTVVLKNSLYTNRSYFFSVKLSVQEKETLKNFFVNQQPHIRISPSFSDWLFESPYLRVQDYYFMDYTGEQWLTMLSLIRAGLIRKTLSIVTK
jgi:hypothetical protein